MFYRQVSNKHICISEMLFCEVENKCAELQDLYKKIRRRLRNKAG